MKYLIVQQWKSTRGNHAGMEHMCDLLISNFPGKYKKVVKDIKIHSEVKKTLFHKLLVPIHRYTSKLLWAHSYMTICQPIFDVLKNGDEVFLLEYNWPDTSQYELACYIRKNYPEVKIYALSHITPSLFSRQKRIKERILKWDRPIDKQLTLGFSLSQYFESLGINPKKISTGFHYVDADYYRKRNDIRIDEKPLTIITMGLLQRDFSLLANIVNKVQDVQWIICRGRNCQVDNLFVNHTNVTIKGYMQEDELRHLMDISDISLNVFEDTVGSNVITTSMAMGLAIVASDVGSIRDYCDDSNSILCDNSEDSFVDALKQMTVDVNRVREMRLSSLQKAKRLNIEQVDEWFSNL